MGVALSTCAGTAALSSSATGQSAEQSEPAAAIGAAVDVVAVKAKSLD